jgi:hypothetical protein
MAHGVARRASNPASGSSRRNIPIQNHAYCDVLVSVVWAMAYECTTAAMPATSHQTTEAATATR